MAACSSLNTSINNAGGNINIGARSSSVLVNGITITGGTINGPASLTFVDSNSNVLDGVTSNTNLDLTNGSRVQLKDGLSLAAANSINLDNGALLAFDNSQTFATGTIDIGSHSAQEISVEGTSTLTISAGVLIHGASATIGNQAFVNGTATPIINNGTISADVSGGTINLESSAFTNTGILSSANGGALELDTSIDNTGGNINVGAASTVLVNGVSITGGTINGPASLTFVDSNSNVLDDVTSNTNLDLTNGSRVRLDDGLSLAAANSINLDNGALLAFDNSQTFATGTIDIGSHSAQEITVEGDSTLTISAGVLIHGASATIGNQAFVNGANAITNNGTISADVAGGTITLESHTFTNIGTLSSANGGALVLNTSINNAGGNINIGAASSVLVNGITITGGTINGPASLTFVDSNDNILNGVTSNTNLDLTNGSRVRLDDGLSLAAANFINLDNGALLAFDNSQTFATGTIDVGSHSNQEISVEGTSTLTISAGVLIHGANATIGNEVFVNGANAITNNGTISADVAGGTITLESQTFTNTGTLSSANGGTALVLNTSINNAGGNIDIGRRLFRAGQRDNHHQRHDQRSCPADVR